MPIDGQTIERLPGYGMGPACAWLRWVGWRVLSICLVLQVSALTYADWPVTRGDALASGAIAQALPAELEELWCYSVPESGFEATAVIADGMVYVGDVDGSFHAVQLSDGEKLWSVTFEDAGFLAAALIHKDRLYVGDFDGIVRCLDRKDGREIWQYSTDSQINAAPNVYRGRLLLTTEGGSLVALDITNGQSLWDYTIEAPLRCWPTVVNGQVLLAGCDGKLHTVDAEDGKPGENVSIGGPTGATPALLDERIFFGNEDGDFLSLSGTTFEELWKYRDPKRAQGIRTDAAVAKQAVVYGSQSKKVYALHPEKGDLLWEFPTKNRVESSPVIAGRVAYFATVRGRLYGVDLMSGEAVWDYNTGGGFLASPAVSDGKLVIGNNDGVLHCFGKK